MVHFVPPTENDASQPRLYRPRRRWCIVVVDDIHAREVQPNYALVLPNSRCIDVEYDMSITQYRRSS